MIVMCTMDNEWKFRVMCMYYTIDEFTSVIATIKYHIMSNQTLLYITRKTVLHHIHKKTTKSQM